MISLTWQDSLCHLMFEKVWSHKNEGNGNNGKIVKLFFFSQEIYEKLMFKTQCVFQNKI